MDAEACPIATYAKDASGTSSSICPTEEAATHTDDGYGYATSAYDVVATPDCATSAMGAPDAPSSICSPIDAAIGYASPVDAVAALAPLPLTPGAVPVGSWCVCRRRLFFGASLRRVPCPLTLQRTWQSVYDKNSLEQKDEKTLDSPQRHRTMTF